MTLGACASAGVAPLDVLRAAPLERSLLLESAKAAIEHQGARDQALATRVVNTLAEAMKKR